MQYSIILASFLALALLLHLLFNWNKDISNPLEYPSSNLPKFVWGLNNDERYIIERIFGESQEAYTKEYWDFQLPLGNAGGKLEQWKFREFIPEGAKCVDFGAGGGFLLQNLEKCRNKRGVEINPFAREHALRLLASTWLTAHITWRMAGQTSFSATTPWSTCFVLGANFTSSGGSSSEVEFWFLLYLMLGNLTHF